MTRWYNEMKWGRKTDRNSGETITFSYNYRNVGDDWRIGRGIKVVCVT